MVRALLSGQMGWTSAVRYVLHAYVGVQGDILMSRVYEEVEEGRGEVGWTLDDWAHVIVM